MQETVNRLTERNALLQLEVDSKKWSSDDNSDVEVAEVMGKYVLQIEQLQAKLIESEELQRQLVPRSVKAPVFDGPYKLLV